MARTTKTIWLGAAAAIALAPPAFAQVAYDNAGTYSSGYGASGGSYNQPVNASLRDANGNLTLVNGQFTSSTMSQMTGVQNMSQAGTGVGFGGGTTTSTANGTATAIGNSLNVITTGSNNTVVVNSVQNNSGNQTATVSMNGH